MLQCNNFFVLSHRNEFKLNTILFQVCCWDSFLQECSDEGVKFGDPQSVPLYEFSSSSTVLPLSPSDKLNEPRLMYYLPAGFYTPYESPLDDSIFRLQF